MLNRLLPFLRPEPRLIACRVARLVVHGTVVTAVARLWETESGPEVEMVLMDRYVPDPEAPGLHLQPPGS